MEKIDLLIINPPFHTRNGGGSFFPLGLGYIISSVVAQGFSWRVIDCTQMVHSFHKDDLQIFEERLSIELQKYSPLVVGMGPCITSQLQALKVISNCCKKVFPSTPIFAGGPLASIQGQEWLFFEDLHIDFIIKGDGENAVPDAIRTIKDSGCFTNSRLLSWQGYSYVNEIQNIDSILFPYRELGNKDTFSTRRSATNTIQKQAAMITSRGCPYKCNYCVSGNLRRSRTVRKRSVDNIIAEMDYLHRDHKIHDVIFYDDCFFSNPQTAFSDVKSFCEALICKNLDISWQIELRPDLLVALDDDSILLLIESGCRQINIGIEKVSASGLEFLGKADSFPGLKQKNFHIREISNISLSATFILGGGNETRNDVIHLIKESKSLGLNFAHFNPLFVYPGTPLYNQVFDNDRAWAEIICNDTLPWGEIVFENDSLKRSDLLELVDYAYSEFYKDTEHSSQLMISDRFNIK